MSQRHAIAAQATKCNDLMQLAQMLALAADECIKENVFPHTDKAVKVIAHQIAFTANADGRFLNEYIEVLKECVEAAPNSEFIQNVNPIQELPN